MNTLAMWQYPLSLILALTFLTGVYALWRYLPEGRLRSVLGGRALCITSLVAIIVMLGIEGTWGVHWHRHIVFWLVSMLMMTSMQFATLDAIKAAWQQGGKHRISSIFTGKTVSHLGFFLVAFGALWGAPDVEDTHMVAFKDECNMIAYTSDRHILQMPFGIRLDEFRIDYYDDGKSPKQYTSRLEIDGKEYETSVNHPCYHDGYWIYQSDFDHDNQAYSVLKVIADPWLPIIYIGIALLAIGAFLRMRLDWQSRYLTVAILLVSVLFTLLSIARINFGTLMPALRSWWFVPHLVLYMIAYSSLALSLVLATLSLCGTRKDKFMPLSVKLFNTASSLLLLGMLCGSVWAKAAWGDWWMWDAKENWAAVTWLMTLVGVHLPHGTSRRDITFTIIILLSFMAMQMAWYGVNYVPAAKASLHTYNQ